MSDTALPRFVNSEIFPFEGEFRIRAFNPPTDTDRPRTGEPGGGPCEVCDSPDEEYIWVDDFWRVRATNPSAVRVQLFLECRPHIDFDDLDDEQSASLGVMLRRINRAMVAVGGVGRVHIMKWGDGASHFHMWFYARPIGASQMYGWCLPMWSMILPPTDQAVWNRNLAVVAHELAKDGGRAIVPPPEG